MASLNQYLMNKRELNEQTMLRQAQANHLNAEAYASRAAHDPESMFKATQPFVNNREATNTALTMKGLPELGLNQGPPKSTWAPQDIDRALMEPANQDLAQSNTLLGQVRAMQKLGVNPSFARAFTQRRYTPTQLQSAMQPPLTFGFGSMFGKPRAAMEHDELMAGLRAFGLAQ